METTRVGELRHGERQSEVRELHGELRLRAYRRASRFQLALSGFWGMVKATLLQQL